MNNIKWFLTLILVILLASCASLGYKKVSYMQINSRGCYVCQRMEPVLDIIEKEYGNIVDISTYAATSDDTVAIIKKYNIKKFPANIFLDDKGNVFFRYEGLLDAKAIRDVLKIKGIESPQTQIQPTATVVTIPAK
ncbi:MAG: thioredoxin family protein [bacterium]